MCFGYSNDWEKVVWEQIGMSVVGNLRWKPQYYLYQRLNRPIQTLLLSLFIPTEEDLRLLDLEHSRYELLQRGGYMSGSQDSDFRHLRKKSVYMFNVGSVFYTTGSLKGKVVDLKPDWNDERMHPVFRSGKPFVVSVKTTVL